MNIPFKHRFVFVLLCFQDLLYLFGGSYFNGNKTFMYNDLFTYNIKKNTWLRLCTPLAPPPRCAQQAVIVAQGNQANYDDLNTKCIYIYILTSYMFIIFPVKKRRWSNLDVWRRVCIADPIAILSLQRFMVLSCEWETMGKSRCSRWTIISFRSSNGYKWQKHLLIRWILREYTVWCILESLLFWNSHNDVQIRIV